MISVYAVIKTKSKEQNTGAWKGPENTAPEGCIEMDGRNGKVETHYWVEHGDATPKNGQKCLCGKERYNEEISSRV